MTTTDSTTLARPATRSLAIVPLRVFLGATFVDAGLGKLLSAAYLGTGPQGFAAQARGFAHGSPIGWLVRAVALPHPVAAGLLLAVGSWPSACSPWLVWPPARRPPGGWPSPSRSS